MELLDGADDEIEDWQDVISDIGEQHAAHPGLNQIRFESASRAMGPLDQLEALLHDVLELLGAGPRSPGRHRADAAERPRRPRRWPAELAGVPESHLQGDQLKDLTYAQLHALTMADDPDEVAEMGLRWDAISRSAWHRGSRLYDMVHQMHGVDPRLQWLADGYRSFAARTDHYAKTFANAAENQREARTKLEELGPP